MQIDHYLRADLEDVPAWARELEALGFDGLYTAEGPHEPFFPLVLAAEHTTRATLFTNIAIAFARSPMDLAQMADGLQRLAGGRFALGLGSQIRPHIEHRFSMTWSRPVARIRELVGAIKAIQTAWNDGSTLADARQRVRGLLGFYGSTPAYRVTLDAHGWGDLQPELNRLTKEGRWDGIARVLPDEVVDKIAVCCRPDEVADRIQARYGDAVDRVGLSMPYDAGRDTLAAIVAGFRH